MALGPGEPTFLIARERGVVLARDVPAEQTANGFALADALRRTSTLQARGVMQPRDSCGGHARMLRRDSGAGLDARGDRVRVLRRGRCDRRGANHRPLCRLGTGRTLFATGFATDLRSSEGVEEHLKWLSHTGFDWHDLDRTGS